jgi:hypothetical protein
LDKESFLIVCIFSNGLGYDFGIRRLTGEGGNKKATAVLGQSFALYLI